MKTQYVLFCLENNKYLFLDHNALQVFQFTSDYIQAIQFATKDDALKFLEDNISNIKEAKGVTHFTTREWFCI